MISVGIAAYNEEKSIGRVLSLWQKEPVDEIVVVSDESTDRTDKIIEEISRKDKRVHLFRRSKRKGKPSAVNEILKKAKGNILIMADADVYPVEGLTKHLVKHFRDKKTGLVAGHPILTKPRGMVGYWSEISFDLIHEKRKKDIGWDVTGNLYALRAGIVKKIPEEVMLDDTHIALNVKRKNFDIVYEPEAMVLVKPPETIRDFIAQKSRTRAGWYQITKDEKTKAKRSVMHDLKLSLPLALKKLLTPKGIICLPSLYVFSLVVWINGWWQWKRRKKVLDVWKIAETTKH